MKTTKPVTTTGPFSVIILLGLFAKHLPLSWIQPFLNKAMSVMQNKHPNIFSRLIEENYVFVIDPIDLPFSFYLKPNLHNPVLKAIKKTEQSFADATIKGTFINLLMLFEGKIDGDAAFFSKELIIEGSTVATVALRNAIDSEDMDITKDLSEIFSPFDGVFLKFSKFALKHINNLQSDISIVSKSISYNNSNNINRINSTIEDMQDELDNITSTLKQLTKDPTRKKSDYKATDK